MAFRHEKVNSGNIFLHDTAVENMFINEYMAAAPGDFVKVYLFAMMYADAGLEITNESIAQNLGMDVEDVLKAWTYWEGKGAVRKHFADEHDRLSYDVEFVRFREQLYGISEPEPAPYRSPMADREIQEMLAEIEKATGEVINGTNMTEIVDWISTYHVSPELIAYTYRYCAGKKKKNIKYVETVLRNWVNEGLVTVEDIEKRVSELDQKQYLYKRVFRALGFNRNVTEEEQRIMDKWFGEMGFTIDKVLEACKKTSGISNPNINYINKVLTNWREEGDNPVAAAKHNDVSLSDVSKYYEMLREKSVKEAEKRRAEVYRKVPRIKEIEETLTKNASEMTKLIISKKVNKQQLMDELKESNDSLNIEEAFLLTDNGFEVDHMEVKHVCDKCKDTGMLETGERCQCFGEVTKEKISQLKKMTK